MIKRFKPFYDNEPGGNQPSATPAPAAPEETVEQVEEKVEQAAETAEQAASKTGDDGWKVIADKLDGLRGDIAGLRDDLKQSVKKPEKAEQKAAAPVVNAPAPVERWVMRNGRRVKRVGA